MSYTPNRDDWERARQYEKDSSSAAKFWWIVLGGGFLFIWVIPIVWAMLAD